MLPERSNFFDSDCKNSLNVLRDNVGFEVYFIVGLEVGKICDLPRLWNDCDFEIPFRKFRNCEADAFDCDRTFENEITGNLRWIRNAHGPRAAVVYRAQKPSARVNVSLNDVAAKTRCRGNSAFKIHRRAMT